MPPRLGGQGRAARADAGEEHVADRAVHRVGHLLGEDRARGADEHAGHDQRGVVERDAGGGGAEAGEGVQGRDDDRHVRAADRHHREHAEQAGGEQDQEEQQLRVRAGRDHDGERDRDQQQGGVDLARDLDRALERLLELEEGDVRAPEGDRADDRREQDRDQRLELEVAAGLAELHERDQRHRAAADAVEQRHHLRHRGHLHAARARDADRGADREADDDQPPVADARLQQRRDHRDRHADGRDLVAAHRRARAAQHVQPDDEHRRTRRCRAG